MKRSPMFSLLFVLLSGYLLALVWFGRTFVSYAFFSEPLQVDRVDKIAARLGEPLQLDMTGRGFDRNTRVNLLLDVNNREAIVGRLPIPGYPADMHLSGDKLLVANMHEGLQAFDVSVPARPKYLWRSLRNYSILDIEPIDDQHFALSCATQGVKIANIRSGNAVIIESAHWPKALTESKYHRGFLYVAAHLDGLLVYDLNDLSAIKPVGKVSFPPTARIKALLIHQEYLFAATSDHGVRIYHLADPAAPKLVNQIEVGHSIYDMARIHGELFLVEKDIGVRRYDLSDPAEPRQISNLTTVGSPRWIDSYKDFLVVADSQNGLMTVPLPLENAPASYAHLDAGRAPKAKVLVGDYLYLGLDSKGLVIVDPQQIKPKQQLQSVAVPGYSHDLTRDGRWLYIVAAAGLSVYDLEAQKIVAALPIEGVSRLTHQDKRLYLVGNNKTVFIVDVADPQQPRILHQFQARSSLQNIAVAADTLALSGPGGVSIYDLSGPEEPTLVDHFPLERATDVHIADQLIYVAADQQGMVILELMDQEKLREVGRSVPPWPLSEFASAQELVAAGGFVYLANGRSGLSVIDVQDPARPKLVSTLKLPGYALGLGINGQHLAISSRFAGVHYLDIRNPREPKLLGSFDVLDTARGVLLEDGKIYITSGNQGVSVLPAPVEMKRVDRLSSSRMHVELSDVSHPGRYSLQVSNGRELSVEEGVVSFSRRAE